MSRSSFAEFAARIQTDEALQRDLRERFGGSGGEIPAQQLIDFAAEQGYAFSTEEAAGQLTEAELDGVAGGTLNTNLIKTTSTLTLSPDMIVFRWDPGPAFPMGY